MATTLLGNITLPLHLDLPTKTTSEKRVKSIQFDMISSSLTLLLASTRREKEVVVHNFVAEFDGKSASSSRRERGVRFARKGGKGSEEEGGFYDDEDDEDVEVVVDWREEMRRSVKESEEMKELERKAMELQEEERERSRGRGGGGDEESEEEKKLRVRRELEKVAKEQAERRATAQLMFDLGQKAYGRGLYGRAIEFLEAALTIIPRPTLFGGEIQIWLAMAYEANDRHEDCITLYQQLQKAHPIISIRRQASELLYIMQAPKIKITQEEMVTIPRIGSSYDSYASFWTDKSKDQITTGSVSSPYPSRDYLGDILKWKPPVGLESNLTFWAALTVWLGLVGLALFLNR